MKIFASIFSTASVESRVVHFSSASKKQTNACRLLMPVSFLLMMLLCSVHGIGQVVKFDVSGLPGGSNNFGTSPLAPTSNNANVTVVGLTRGSGIGVTGTGAGKAWGGTGFTTANNTQALAISGNQVVTFSITPNTGYTTSLSGIPIYNIRRSAAGPSTGIWQYKVGAGAFTDIGSAITWGTTTTATGNDQAAISLSGISALQNVPAGTTITFRVVLWGSTATTGTWYFNDQTSGTRDLIVNGTVDPVGAAPVINSPLTATATVGTLFTYTITALNSPTSFSSSTTFPVNGLNFSSPTISGIPTTATAPGTEDINITATNGVGSDNQVLKITVNKGNQTLTGLPALDNSRTYGDAPYNLNVISNGGGANSGNAITYSSSPAGVVTFSGNQVTIIGAGTTTITASQSGNTNWNAATDITQTLNVSQLSQTITFGALSPKPDNAANFQLTATGGASGNPITYTSSNTAVAIIVDNLGNPDPNGNWVDILAAGSTTITATQAGNANYSAASPVQQVQVITSTSLTPQTITNFPLTDTRTYGDANYQLTATGGGSGNPVTYQSLNTAVATIVDNLGNPDPNGTYLHIVSNGVATIRASQAGNGFYNPAPDVDQVLTVGQKEITVSGAVAGNKPYDGTDAATISGYTINGIVGGDNILVSGGGTFASVNAGTWAVTAALVLGGTSQAKYYLTQPTNLSAIISPLTQTITAFPLTDTRTYTATLQQYILSATGGASGNPVTYVSDNPAVATITGNQVTITGAGTASITASQAGNINYNPAADVVQALTVNKAAQTISFAALANKTTADAPFTLSAVSNSGATPTGLAITYTSSNPAVADVVGNVVTIYGRGTTDITASQSGSTNYLSATSVTRTLIVTAPLIAAWDFTGPGGTGIATFAASIFNANLNSSNLITRGATAASSVGANSFRTTGFKNDGISTSNTDYFQTTLAVTTGKLLSLSDITAKFNGTLTFVTGSPATAPGGVSFQFAYSLDGTNFTMIGATPATIGSSTSTSATLTMSPIDLSGITALQNVPSGTTVTIRYYASGQTTTGGWGFFSAAVGDNGLSFGGSITNVPCAVTGTATTTAVCLGNTDGTATVTLAGSRSGAPGTYSLDGGPATAFSANPFTITGLSGGMHTIVATVTAGGCVSSPISADVTINPLPTVSFAGLAATYCTTDAAVTLTGNPAGGTFSGPGISGNTFDPATAGAGGPYTITYTYSNGTCSNTSTQQVSVNVCATFSTLDLTLFLEGFYRGESTMAANIYDLGTSTDPTETDTITVNLWSATSLSNETPDYSMQTVLHTNGNAEMQFPAAVNGNSFYIAVKHRNSIETWSHDAVLFSVNTSYNFSTGLDKAYDDGVLPPMKEVGGVFTFYAGDINQDGGIDGQDMNVIDNEVGFFGYNMSDVNGDMGTDGQDMNFVDNNSQLGLFFARPY